MISLVLLCSLAGNQEHALDASQTDDHVAPSLTTASFTVERSEDTSGCAGGSVSTCGDLALVVLSVSATDDVTAQDQVGYQIQLVDGELPRGLTLPATAVVPSINDQLFLYFDYDDRRGFTADLEIRAIDLNGNLGPPSIITISEAGESGCRSTGAPGAGLWVLLAFAWLMRPARARVTR